MRHHKATRTEQEPFVRITLIIIGIWAFMASVSHSRAQVVTATVVGIVRDTSGAVVPKTKVTVRNVATGLSQTALTDNSGNYSVGALNPGQYVITAEYAGFRVEEVTGIVLQVNQTARINITLHPGQVHQTVEVKSSAPLIDTENSEIGSVVGQQQILEIPLNGRNFMELTTLTAGINEGESSTAKSYAGFAPAAAGQPSTENNYTLDGADNKNRYLNSFSVAPSVDAIQEFAIQVGQYSAEFGSGAGAVINVATRSGTNNFHGEAFEFLRNEVFDARNFFAATRSPLRRNQFGASAGGPIKKDKAFFFVNYDGTRDRAPGTAVATVPTDAERAGDLSALNEKLTNPLTGSPFAGGVIPSNEVSAISKGIAAYYPEPNVPGVQVSNFVRSFSNSIDQDSGLARVDYSLSEKNNLMVRYALQNFTQNFPGTFPLVGGTSMPERYQNVALNLTSNVNPHLLNEFRFAYDRWNNFTEGQNTGDPIAQKLGLRFYATSPQDAGFPQNVGLSSTIFSGIGESYPFLILSNTFQWYDGITWTKGNHTIKAGADVTRNRAITDCAVDGNGSYSFSGQYTGDGFADFLLGYPSGIMATLSPTARVHEFQTQQSYYVLDDWKTTPKLTLNLGLRYELDQYPWDKEGAAAIFDPSLRKGNVTGGLLYPEQNTAAEPFYTQERPDLPFGFVNRKSIMLPDKDNFAPRFGFAYRPFSGTSTVVRGGYGWFYSSPQNINLVGNAEFAPPEFVTPNFVGNPVVPNLTWNGIPGVPNADFVKSLTFGALTGPETQFLSGLTQQWSLSVGHEVARNTAIEVQYLGSRSTDLENSLDYNWTTPSPLPLVPRLPYPAWGRMFGFSSGANATYNALMVSADRRFASGLTFHAAYTYGKAMTYHGGRITAGNIGEVQDPANLAVENGPTADDVTHRFVLSYIYDLPFGPGQHFGRSTGGIAGKIIGGWKLSGVTTLRTGFALFGPYVANANCNSSFCNYCRPDLIGPNPTLGGNGVNTPRFNVAAFDWPLNPAHALENPRFGDAAPNMLRGDGLDSWDMALLKHSKFRERYDWEFRFEMFNFPNIPNFADPTTEVDSPLFGRTFGAADGRDIQFGLKFYW